MMYHSATAKGSPMSMGCMAMLAQNDAKFVNYFELTEIVFLRQAVFVLFRISL